MSSPGSSPETSPETSPAPLRPHPDRLLPAEPGLRDIARELYFAILHDRATSGYTIIASTEGGVNIEDVAEHTPEKIVKVAVHPTLGLQAYQSRNLASALGLRGREDAISADHLARSLVAHQQVFAVVVEQVHVVARQPAVVQACAHLASEDLVSQALRLADLVLVACPGHRNAAARRFSEARIRAVK